ncbi:MAG: GIN domain-containing protein [Pseudonocardiaceae bacterium]
MSDPGRGLRWWTVRTGRAVAVLAVTGLLAGCLGTSAGSPSGTAGTGTDGTSGSAGNGYGGRGGDGGSGGNGGRGGDGGDGYGGWGGNSYGGDGGDGADGAPGVDGAPGFGFSDPAAVAGSGRLTSRTVDLSGVTSVAVDAGFVVHLRTGGPAQAVVRMDDNLVDRIDATVTGDQLHLGIKPGMSVRNATLSAELRVGQLDRLTAGGASRVIVASTVMSPVLALVVSGAGSVTGPIQIGRMQATVSGAGTLALSGEVGDLRLIVAGGARLPLAQLTVRRLDAMLSGACHVVATVSDTLAATASGASVLRYRGTPRVTRSQTSGMSSVAQDSP